MIPNIIRLQEQMKEVHARLDDLTARIITLEARGALADAHIENLIERVYELEGGE